CELGRVDGILLECGDGPPRLSAVLIGFSVLSHRIHPVVGRCVAAVERLLGANGHRTHRSVSTIDPSADSKSSGPSAAAVAGSSPSTSSAPPVFSNAWDSALALRSARAVAASWRAGISWTSPTPNVHDCSARSANCEGCDRRNGGFRWTP